jgi:hypothetical protein
MIKALKEALFIALKATACIPVIWGLSVTVKGFNDDPVSTAKKLFVGIIIGALLLFLLTWWAESKKKNL